MTDVLRFDASAQLDGRTDRWFRTALFVVAFLLIWITISPFSDLGDLDHVESTNAGNLAGQLATLALTAAMVVFIVRHQPQLLTKAVTPILIVTLAWFALSGAFSHYPELSIRRVILAALTIFQAVVFLMLAPTREEFARLLALCSLVILGLCYAGIVLIPDLSIHQFGDLREPQLAGAWRGVFAHKNGAGSCMALLIFIGIFAYRSWNRTVGGLIIALAIPFLIMTEAKSPLRLLPVVLGVVWLAGRIRNPVALVALLLSFPILIHIVTIGSVISDPIRDFLEEYSSDPSFTGRDTIWSFAIDQTLLRPFLGHGFQAFWGTDELVSAWNPQESWGYRASDGHSSVLNLSVMTGFVGMGLALLWIVVQPLVDYLRCRTKDTDPALTAFFLQIWLFGLCLSGFESVYFSGGSALWFMIVVAMLGLRYQQAFRLRG